MREKFYSLCVLMLMVVLNMSAQTTVTSLDQLSNEKCYTIKAYDSTRGSWMYNAEDPGTLYGTAYAGVTEDATSEAQHFAILKSPNNNTYYFYSVAGKKFLHGNDDYYVYFTDAPTSANNKLISSSASKQESGFPWVACDGDCQFNMSSNQGTGVLSNWNDTNDGGNAISITEAGTFDPTEALAQIVEFEGAYYNYTIHYVYKCGDTVIRSYDVIQMVEKGATISFDAPKDYFGLKGLSTQRADETATSSQEITVTYEYEANYDVLPFVATTITDGKFADNTKWYYISIRNANRYLSSSTEDSYVYSNDEFSNPIDSAAFFTFVGNPATGFNIYNCALGAGQSIYASESDGSYPTFQTEGMPMYLEQGDNGTFRFNISTDDDQSAYLNDYKQNGYLRVWDWFSYGQTDEGSVFYIKEVPAEDLNYAANGGLIRLVSVTPESGDLNGALTEVNLTFDTPIAEIDTYKSVTLTDADGNVIATPAVYINEDNHCQIDVVFTRPVTTLGQVYLNIPTPLLIGENEAKNVAMTIPYNIKDSFAAVTVTGRVYSYDPWIGDGSTVWSLLTFPEGAEYFNCTVEIKAKDDIVITGYTGNSDDSIELTLDNSTNQILTIDGQTPDEYTSVWVDTSIPDYYYGSAYYGCYIYAGSYSSVINGTDDPNYGRAILETYCYNTWNYEKIYIDWYFDNQYANEDEEESVQYVTTAPQSRGTYSVAGYRMNDNSPLQRGLYIRDGKKVMVK